MYLDLSHKVLANKYRANWHCKKFYTLYIQRDTMRGSKIFFRGGRGGQARRRENSLDNLFFFLFLSPQLSLQFTEGSNGFIIKKTILFQGSRGGPTFSRGRGVQLFPGGGGGGGQMLIFFFFVS